MNKDSKKIELPAHLQELAEKIDRQERVIYAVDELDCDQIFNRDFSFNRIKIGAI